MISFRLLYQVEMDLKLHVNLIISFSTETSNKAINWHHVDLAFKIAVEKSKRSSHHLSRGTFDSFHSNSSHLPIVFLPQSNEPPTQSDSIDACASDMSWGPRSWISLLENKYKDIMCSWSNHINMLAFLILTHTKVTLEIFHLISQ